ncbi:hypothetical protein RB653_005830 [Dictyostelium firmibasis]|uniref:Legume lectin domain-containing protein n=1 Tax=Dictyostelium firmibasis TaxID=79012 RepID=A0AAN7U8P9_9MYCE
MSNNNNSENRDELFFKVFRNVFLKNKVLDNSFYIFDNTTTRANGDAFFEDNNGIKIKKEEKQQERPSPYARTKMRINPSLRNLTINDNNNNNNNINNNNDNNNNNNNNNDNNNNNNNNNKGNEKREIKSNKFNLTNDKSDQVGSVFSNIKLPLESDLLVKFTFEISKPQEHNEGADGFAFVIQSSSDKEHSYRYTGGATLGYHDIPKKDGAVAVEFDTYMNEDEPNNNHISIQGCSENGRGLSSSNKYSVASAVPSFPMKDGLPHKVEIKYNHKETSLSVSVDSVELLNNIHVPDLVGLKQAYFGFTSATGYFHSKHSILYCEILKQ